MFSFGRVITALSICFLSISCQPKLEDMNEDFTKKYGSQVDLINNVRTPPGVPVDPLKDVRYSRAPTPEQVAIETANDYYHYVDVTSFGEKVPQIYLPNTEFYGQAQSKPAAAPLDDIFEIKYNTALYPPFRRIGAEFDVIKIPPYDVYGVKTAMSDKTYLLPGGEAVQGAVDNIEDNKAGHDDEIAATLVAEKKQILRKKKSAKMLGEQLNSQTEVENKTKEKPKSETAAKAQPAKVQLPASNNNANSGFTIQTVKN